MLYHVLCYFTVLLAIVCQISLAAEDVKKPLPVRMPLQKKNNSISTLQKNMQPESQSATQNNGQPYFLEASSPNDWGFLTGLDYELRFGVLAHAMGPFARGKEYGSAYNLELRFPLPDWKFLKWIWQPRITLGGTMNPNEQTDQIYTTLLWRFNTGRSWFLDFELGGAVHNGELESLAEDRRQYGSPGLFRLSLAINYRLTPRMHLGLSLDHISNAYLYRRNEGLDQFGLIMGIAY